MKTLTTTCNNLMAKNGAKLVVKYKGIRFFDADIGTGGTDYRVQSDQFT